MPRLCGDRPWLSPGVVGTCGSWPWRCCRGFSSPGSACWSLLPALGAIPFGPRSTWPRRPGPPPGAQCIWLASWNSSIDRRSSMPVVPRRSSLGPGPCRRGRTPRSVRCSRRRVAGNSPVYSHGCKCQPLVAEGVAGKSGLFPPGGKFYFMYSSQGVSAIIA